MATVEIQPGACGFVTVVKATATASRKVDLTIQSNCEHIKKLAEKLSQVDALKELSGKRGITSILAAGVEHCAHAACPVPCGIVKAVEVAAKLSVPRDVSIRFIEEE